MKLVSVEEMRALEAASEAAGVSTAQLMENAGLAVARALWQRLGDVTRKRILVLVGQGNNGGDGLVAGRYLQTWGARLVHYLCAQRPSPDPHQDAGIFLGIPTVPVDDDSGFARLRAELAETDVVLDAVLGIGRGRALEAPLTSIFQAVCGAKAQRPSLLIAAVDLPTGLNAETGQADPSTLPVDLTLTLGSPKLGLFLGDGPEYTGHVRTLDIGIPVGLDTHISREVITAGLVRGLLPARAPSSHKGTHGRALIIAGSRNFVGAAALACGGAGRVGAGLVTLATPASLQPLFAPHLPETTHLPLPEGDSPGLLSSIAVPHLAETEGYSAFLLGCGIGQDPRTVTFVRAALLQPEGLRLAPLVLDADGLNSLAGLDGWWSALPAPAVLTPHPGEMARLTGLSTSAVQRDRLELAERYAREWNVILVLKGAHTIVAAPDGRTRVSPWAVPALATAGTGDVLAGAITGLLAQGLAPFDAAACAVYLHGLAGRMFSEEMGDAGLLASDLLQRLPRAVTSVKKGGPGLEW